MTSTSIAPYLPRLIRTWDGSPGPRELEGTLVSVDLSGFTRLSERLQAKGRVGAEELVLAVSGVFEGLIGIAERHGGDVLKFRGDALLILFDGDAHELRACRASWHMQWLIGETGRTMSSVGEVTLSMSTGIYTGLCHFFLVEGSHLELVVAGPAATETIALESEATAGEILVSPRTAAALDPSWLGDARGDARLLRRADDDAESPLLTSAERASGLEAYVPADVRAHLRLEAGEAEHRQVTAAFVKFTGVDAAIAERGVDEVHASLAELARVVGEETDRLGLTWLESDIETGGGKLYLVGGAPSSTGADEDRMLRALRAILASDCPFDLRAGVNRGPAFCGDIGASTRRTYAVMGDTVNLAARLTARADERGILATAEVLDRARTRFETTPQPFLVKGKEQPITAYRVGELLGEKPDEVVGELPFVGREHELAAFAAAIDEARLRRQQLVDLAGEPGMGKSRLIGELEQRAVGFTQLRSACDQYASATPYAAFRTLLRSLVGITPEVDAASAGAQLQPWAAAVMPDLAPMLPLLAVAFDATVDPTPETDALEPQFRRERLHETVAALLGRVLLMPTLIVLEDAHWMDDASRDLVHHLSGEQAPRPWLICVTRRPQAAAFAGDVPGHTLLELGPIDGSEARSLALASAGDDGFAADALAAIVDRAGGNPLFIRELVNASRAGGTVASLPDSIETLILARIDTLDPADRFLLRNASVLGASFSLDLLAEILAPELPDIVDLERWERLSEFVAWSGSHELRFQHDLFRAVAYEGLSFRRRREVHARVGRALERAAGDTVDEAAALLSLHFHRADEPEPTWRYAVVAGRRAQERSAAVEAVEQYERALEVAEAAGATPHERARVAEDLGDVAERAGRYPVAESAYALARGLAVGDQITQTHLLRKEGVLRERQGRYDDALRRYERALKELDRAPDSIEKARSRVYVLIGYAGVKYRQGRFDEAREWAARAAEEAAAADDEARLAHAYYLSHVAAVAAGDRDPEHRDEALRILENAGDYGRLTNVQNNVGIEAYFDGRWDDALEWYRRSADSAQRVGDVVNVARARNNEAEILSDQGRLDEARELFEEALRVWRGAGYRIGIAVATSNLGRLAARSGSFADAHRLLADARALFEELGSEAFAAEAATRIAECFVLAGRHPEATAALTPLLEGGGALESRLAGYAVVQSRAPFAEAKPYFDAALAAARGAGSPYELALTLRAVASTGGDDDGGEADTLLRQLGVVATPVVPLP